MSSSLPEELLSPGTRIRVQSWTVADVGSVGKSPGGAAPPIVEAGTGNRQDLGLPFAVIRSGKTALIISTGTKNLQETAVFKDIPSLNSIWANWRCLHERP